MFLYFVLVASLRAEWASFAYYARRTCTHEILNNSTCAACNDASAWHDNAASREQFPISSNMENISGAARVESHTGKTAKISKPAVSFYLTESALHCGNITVLYIYSAFNKNTIYFYYFFISSVRNWIPNLLIVAIASKTHFNILEAISFSCQLYLNVFKFHFCLCPILLLLLVRKETKLWWIATLHAWRGSIVRAAGIEFIFSACVWRLAVGFYV